MRWRVRTFWLAGRRPGKRLLAISAVSGSRARCRHQGPAVDKCGRAAPSPGQLPVPGIADLASLAMRRLWERLEAGEAAGRPRERANRATADPVSVGAPAFAFVLGQA
jgi:hypothetical protein